MDLGATMATDVPYEALDALVSRHGGRVRVASDGTRVDDARVLRDLPEGEGLGAPCRARLRVRRFEEGPSLVAEVRGEGLQPPVAWWRVQRPHGARTHGVLAGWLPAGCVVEVAARVRRITAKGVAVLVLGSIAAKGARARVDAPIDRHQIGEGWLEAGEPVAFVAGRHKVRPGWHSVSPIQDFGEARLKRQLGAVAQVRAALLELPLVLKGTGP
ncbi:MAG: hypothetical protein ACODAG_08970 [Myxococcota bacterium]